MLGELKRQIRHYILDTEKSIHLDMKAIFKEKFNNIPESWEDVYPTLYKSTDTIETHVINNANKGFQYEDYPKVLKVTLEGLTSYLYTLMYDTLMQMGRWFGYRPRYDNIVYLYMPERSVDWYYQILQAMNDLKTNKEMINERRRLKILDITFVKLRIEMKRQY